jgi:hypothetical protein
MDPLFLLRKIFKVGDEKGAILVAGLLVVLILTVLSLAAMMNTGAELRIAANDRSGKEAFYAAEAGVEDARSRLQTSSSLSPIYDRQPNNPYWTAFIGTEQKSRQKGYDRANSSHHRYDKLNYTNLDYVVTITHKLDSSKRILRWGDSNSDGQLEENTVTGNNIYVVTSEGHTPPGAVKPVRIECAKLPPIMTPAAFYTKDSTTIQGTSTQVSGINGCGTSNVPGIVTMATVQKNGNPGITGFPVPMVERSPTDINVQGLINQLKKYHNYSYQVNSGSPPAQHWGSPTPGPTHQSPTSCNARNIVYINTHNTYVRLTGGSSGCGLLLVEGDLAVHGGFQWYGVILVTGSVTFTGGGGKNVTGAILAGGPAAIDLMGGDANIVYCSQAVQEPTDNLALVTLRWAKLLG